MISVKNISFAYKKSPLIFDDFSLSIKKGSLFGLLGPNGAGKTSLISLIAGLQTPSQGTIELAGRSIARDRDQTLGIMSLVPQEYAFYGQLTALENLSFFAKLYPNNRDLSTVERAIELTGIGEYRDRKANTFSGGLKRRLNLAIGLLNDPQLLILDEPTVGIDPQSRRYILAAIQALNDQGTTVLYTTHYMTEVEQLCNDIAIIDHGQILRQGTLSELLGTSHRLTATFNRSLLEIDIPAPVAAYFTENGFAIDGLQISSSDFIDADLSRFLKTLEPLKQQGASIKKINYGEQTLEDVFFDLTKTDLRD